MDWRYWNRAILVRPTPAWIESLQDSGLYPWCGRSEEAKTKLRAAHTGMRHSLETRLLMWETRRGPNAYWYAPLTHSEETKAKISAALKGPLSPCFGVPRSAETIALMRTNHPHTKIVYQYGCDRSTFIARYDSLRQAAALTGISSG
jgi:hypothetical protein